MSDLVSVIVPVYKVEAYLDRCLKSIVRQTFKNLQIILVDDGSPDTCPQKCDKWAKIDSRVTVLHKKNEGSSSARNYGLRAAKGEYICFVDSDDWVAENYVEKLWFNLRHYEADVAYCDFLFVSKPVSISQPPEKIAVCGEEQLMRLFFRVDDGSSSYAVWRALYRRELLDGVRFIEGIITEDVPFTYEIYRKCNKAVFTNQKLYFYFQNHSGITYSPLRKKDLILFEIWDNIVADVPRQYHEWAVLNRQRATFTLYVKAILRGKTDEIGGSLLEQWKAEIKRNYTALVKSKMLNWKRKLILTYIKLR